MRHERAHDGERLSARQVRGRVVDRLVQAILSFEARRRQPLQIRARSLGRHHQREHRGIGRDDQILGQAPFQPEAGNAECAILIVESGVDRVVAGLRHAPRHAALVPVRDLPRHRRVIRLVEQRVLVRRHHQQRHQVLEHRAAPGQQDRFAAGTGEQAAEGEPVVLRQLTLRNGDEAGEPCFRRQQIVVTGVAPPVAHVVTDRQQMAPVVIEEAIVHPRHLADLNHKLLDRRNPVARILAGPGYRLSERGQPFPLGQCGGRVQPAVDGVQYVHIERRQFAQRRDRAQAGLIGQPRGGGGPANNSRHGVNKFSSSCAAWHCRTNASTHRLASLAATPSARGWAVPNISQSRTRQPVQPTPHRIDRRRTRIVGRVEIFP